MNAGHPEIMSWDLNKTVFEFDISSVSAPSQRTHTNPPSDIRPFVHSTLFTYHPTQTHNVPYLLTLQGSDLFSLSLSLYALSPQATFSLCPRFFYVIFYHHLILFFFSLTSFSSYFPLSFPPTAVVFCPLLPFSPVLCAHVWNVLLSSSVWKPNRSMSVSQ